MYCSDIDHDIPRKSLISQALLPDKMTRVPGLSVELVKSLAKGSVWNKAKKFQIKTSTVVSTRVELSKNTIHGEVRRGFIYDQEISWGKGNYIKSGQPSCAYKLHREWSRPISMID